MEKRKLARERRTRRDKSPVTTLTPAAIQQQRKGVPANFRSEVKYARGFAHKQVPHPNGIKQSESRHENNLPLTQKPMPTSPHNRITATAAEHRSFHRLNRPPLFLKERIPTCPSNENIYQYATGSSMTVLNYDCETNQHRQSRLRMPTRQDHSQSTARFHMLNGTR